MHITANRVLAQRKFCIEKCSTGTAGAAKEFGASDQGATANSGAAAQGRSPLFCFLVWHNYEIGDIMRNNMMVAMVVWFRIVSENFSNCCCACLVTGTAWIASVKELIKILLIVTHRKHVLDMMSSYAYNINLVSFIIGPLVTYTRT